LEVFLEFLIDYGSFLLKGVTLLVLLMIAVGIITSLKKGEAQERGKLEVNRLNDKYDHMHHQMSALLENKKAVKKTDKQKKKAKKAEAKVGGRKATTFLVDFHGDMQAKQVARLREEISAILTIANDQDEVLVRVESGGGVIHGYGLAASQLDRVRKKGIKLTIAVDKVAASGGYMMACVGDKIIAAPFAILGSIGVVAQLPNINRLLKKHDVDVEMHTAGEYKRTLTMIGENTDEGRKKFVEDLQEAHELFKTFVAEHRPQVDIEKIATGEIWFGNQAIDNKLVDEVMTSDEYILTQLDEREVYEVRFTPKKSLSERLGKTAENTSVQVTDRLIERLSETRFPS
jgi:serine protease SohB